MALELENTLATIKHINARKEGPEDDKDLAVDLKLEIEEAAVVVLPQLAPDLRGMLFNHDQVRFPQMEPIKWSADQQNMELEFLGFTFKEAKLSKFEIRPYINKQGTDRDDYTDIQRVHMTLQASFNPEGREVATIAEMLGEQTKITIRARQQELDV